MILYELNQQQSLSSLEKFLKNKYRIELKLLFLPKRTIQLHTIVIPDDSRNKGIGTEVIKDIIQYADNHKLDIVLNPAEVDDGLGTTSKEDLIRFYERFGFVDNDLPNGIEYPMFHLGRAPLHRPPQ